MTQGDLFAPAPANIVFTVTADVARIAREIGEGMLRPFEVALARTEIRAQAESLWGKVHPDTLSVTAVAVDGTQVTRFSSGVSWPHDQQAMTALEEAISSGQTVWQGNAASYTVTRQDAPVWPSVFRH